LKRIISSAGERGQAIVEFALAAPFLLMFILFMIDLALLGFSYVSLANAVREGARCAVIGADDLAIIDRVGATSGGIGSVASVVASPSESERLAGTDMAVEAVLEYDWITPVGLVPGLAGAVNITKTVVMRMERPAGTVSTCP
jgi:Flp pilus assembly protein TadG